MKLGQLWLYCGIACVIVAAVLVDRALFQVPAASSVAYHTSLREVALAAPKEIGEWKSRDVEVPTAAQKLLQSNVLISREYINPKTGSPVSFLLVQCADARHLSGHYPPICYPNSGFTYTTSYETAAEITAPGVMYNFKQNTRNGTRSIWVYNIMVLPDNQTARGMEGVYRIARNRRMRYFGAAEIQVLTDDKISSEERSEVVNMLLAAYKPMIDAIRSGVVE